VSEGFWLCDRYIGEKEERIGSEEMNKIVILGTDNSKVTLLRR
jgi:hypothetical protein